MTSHRIATFSVGGSIKYGAIVEDGSHAELMALDGRYAALWAAAAAEPAAA